MNNKNEISLGVRLKELRKNLNLTQKELAQKAGLKTTAIISYENNQREPTGRALASLEKVLNVSGSYLFGEELNLSYYDEEIMSAVNDTWHTLFSNINSSLKVNDPVTQKLFFNIMVEFKSILASSYMTNYQKSESISLLHDIVTGLLLSIDRAVVQIDNTHIDKERIENYKKQRIKEYSKLLDTFFDNFNK